MIRFPITLLFSLFLVSCDGGNNTDSESEASIVNDDGNVVCSNLSLNFSNLGAEDVSPETMEDEFAVLNFWEMQVGNTSSTLYGAGGYPEADDDQGNRLFTGGTEELSIAQQTLAVSPEVLGCSFSFNADIGGFDQQEDNATVELAFLSSIGDALTTYSLGPVTPVERQQSTLLIPLSTEGSIPNASAQARLTITQNRLSGSVNDGYVDNISVILK